VNNSFQSIFNRTLATKSNLLFPIYIPLPYTLEALLLPYR